MRKSCFVLFVVVMLVSALPVSAAKPVGQPTLELNELWYDGCRQQVGHSADFIVEGQPNWVASLNWRYSINGSHWSAWHAHSDDADHWDRPLSEFVDGQNIHVRWEVRYHSDMFGSGIIRAEKSYVVHFGDVPICDW